MDCGEVRIRNTANAVGVPRDRRVAVGVESRLELEFKVVFLPRWQKGQGNDNPNPYLE